MSVGQIVFKWLKIQNFVSKTLMPEWRASKTDLFCTSFKVDCPNFFPSTVSKTSYQWKPQVLFSFLLQGIWWIKQNLDGPSEVFKLLAAPQIIALRILSPQRLVDWRNRLSASWKIILFATLCMYEREKSPRITLLWNLNAEYPNNSEKLLESHIEEIDLWSHYSGISVFDSKFWIINHFKIT